MKYSITGKITAIMISIVAGTVLLCWFINTSLLENYYVEHKQQKLLATFRMVDEASGEGRDGTEHFRIRLESSALTATLP